MTRYLTLLRFTQQGARAIKKSPGRAADFAKTCRKAGVTVESQLWTAGSYDGVLILSGDNEARVLNVIATLASLGNVQTESLRAFNAKEFGAIVR
jgi:uncharacterized protein with GYD domain